MLSFSLIVPCTRCTKLKPKTWVPRDSNALAANENATQTRFARSKFWAVLQQPTMEGKVKYMDLLSPEAKIRLTLSELELLVTFFSKCAETGGVAEKNFIELSSQLGTTFGNEVLGAVWNINLPRI